LLSDMAILSLRIHVASPQTLEPEEISFDPEEVVLLLLEGFGLAGLDPKEPAQLAQVINSLHFLKQIGFILFEAGRFRSKVSLLLEPLHSSDGKNTSLQSCNFQIPSMLVTRKEDDTIYEEF
jgi:hypothetical protein